MMARITDDPLPDRLTFEGIVRMRQDESPARGSKT